MDDLNQGHQNWMRLLSHTMQTTIGSLSEVEVSGVSPTTVTDTTDSHRRLHASILNLHSLLEPFSDNLGTVWDDVRKYPTELGTVVVAHDTLAEDWRFRYYTREKQTTDVVSGGQRVDEQMRVWLPPAACADLYQDCNKAMKKLQLAAEIAEPTGWDEPPEVPDHVLENAPMFQDAQEQARADGGDADE